MEIKHRLLQFNTTPKYELLKQELDRLGADYKIKNLGKSPTGEMNSIEFLIGEGDPLYPEVENIIQKHDFNVQTGVYYTQKDIREAEWLYATTGEFQYPQPEDDFIETTYDTTDYCRHCGMGAIQDRPFRLRSDFKQKRSQFLGLHWIFDEMFVRPETKAILENENVTDVTFSQPLHHRKGYEIENVFQMHIETIADPGLVTEGLNTVTCMENNEESWPQKNGEIVHSSEKRSYCGRVKFHFPTRDSIKFNRDTFLNMPDIAKSSEYFGSGAGSQNLILVSRRFADIVSKHKLRGLKFTPIELV